LLAHAAWRLRSRRPPAAKAAVAFLIAVVVGAVAMPGMALSDTASASSEGYAPALTIEKLQKIDGVSGPFASSPLVGKVGQRVDYEIVVTNTSRRRVPAASAARGTQAGWPRVIAWLCGGR
jgi:hypothetical protein